MAGKACTVTVNILQLCTDKCMTLALAVAQGSIPYVPYLRAPYYVWVGHVPQVATILAENKVEAPPCFPPTFLYTQSWEDPRPDMEVCYIYMSALPLRMRSHTCHDSRMSRQCNCQASVPTSNAVMTHRCALQPSRDGRTPFASRA